MMINEYDGTYYIFWDEQANMFYDPCGIRIINIFDLVTPNEIFLFRYNPKNFCAFPMKGEPRTVCIFVTNEEGYQ